MNRRTLGVIIACGVVALAIIIALVFIFGQGKPPAPPKPAPVAVAPVTPPPPPVAPEAPFSYASKTSHAAVSLKLPASLSTAPELRAKLYREGTDDLKKFAEDSAAAQAEDSGDTQPYQRNVKWTTATATSKLLSLQKEVYEDAGGAHPNMTLDAVLWDKALKHTLQTTALFKAGTDYSKLDDVLCDALTAAKKKRLGDSFQPPSSDTWSCPKWTATTVVLAPSTTPGKAGGLTFLMSPYAVGSYAEGPYEITIPASAFKAFLAGAYADEFAGAPTHVGDVTPLK
jgi:hypothetical protein